MKFPGKPKDNSSPSPPPAAEPVRRSAFPTGSGSPPPGPPQAPEPASGRSGRLWMMALLAVVLLSAVGAGWGFIQYNKAQHAHQQQRAELGQQIDQLQRRHAEERARADQAEGLNGSLNSELAALQEEVEILQQSQSLSAGQAQRQIRQLTQQVAEGQKKAENQEAALRKSQAKNDEQLTQLQKLQKEARELTVRNDALDKKLQYANRKIETMAGHNVQLSKAASDLLDAYENKGVFSAMAAKEPFTGLGKIKTEHLIQEYRQQVDKNTVGDTRP